VNEPRGRPIRVILFSGAYLDFPALQFALALDSHPDIRLLGVLCEAPATGWRYRLYERWKRRGAMAVVAVLRDAGAALVRVLRDPAGALERRQAARRLAPKVHTFRNLHAPEVLALLQEWRPDLGAVYGAPILRRELFELPPLGTLGIHHGRVPEYRGRKTTFWEIYNGEATAGVTIQRINAGIDTGEIVKAGEVPVGARSYSRIERETQALGLHLFINAVLEARSGTVHARPQPSGLGRHYRQPKAADFVDLWLRVAARRLGLASTTQSGDTRLLLATETYWPEIGGGERQARSLAATLAARGRSVTILTRRSRPELSRCEQDGAIRVLRLPPAGRGRWKKWLLVLPAFLRLCTQRRRYDVAMVAGFRILGIPALLARALTRKPTVLKADSRGEFSGEYFRAGLAGAGLAPDSWPVAWALRLRNSLLRRADAFVALSDEIAGELLDHGVPAPRVHRIPNGVDTRVFRPASAEERSELRNRLCIPDGPVVVYTGRLVTYKGLPSLLRAWREVPDALLVLVGEGGADIHSCEQQLRDFVGSNGLSDRVRFTGAVERVEDWLRAADLFVFPTENEAFGLSLVEAMACGLASVTTRVGGLRDIVADGDNALVIAAGDDTALATAMRVLLGDAERRAAMGRAARQDAERRFSLSAVTDAYEALFASLHAGAARKPA
jgi:glycosyltransferase involved in cell wall biosynthesis/folate-dependent phosphoribosylglycinamide formyltransferase PurN